MRAPRAFFEQWYPRLVGYLSARLGDTDQAEDIAQDAFVRLLEHQPANPVGWLFTVATHLASDETRIATGRRRHLELIDRDIDAGEDADPVATLVRDEEVARVRLALARLSERDRTLLLLHHDGVRYRDLAVLLGVAPSSVGSLLTRAQRRFATCYALGENADAQGTRG